MDFLNSRQRSLDVLEAWPFGGWSQLPAERLSVILIDSKINLVDRVKRMVASV